MLSIGWKGASSAFVIASISTRFSQQRFYVPVFAKKYYIALSRYSLDWWMNYWLKTEIWCLEQTAFWKFWACHSPVHLLFIVSGSRQVFLLVPLKFFLLILGCAKKNRITIIKVLALTFLRKGSAGRKTKNIYLKEKKFKWNLHCSCISAN